MTIMQTPSSAPRPHEREGTVTRYGDVTLLVGPGDEQVITRLLAAARAANTQSGDVPGQSLSQTVAHLLATSEHVPAVCAIHEMTAGVAALVHGDARVRIHTDHATLDLSSSGAVTVDGFIAGKATSVRAELGPAGEDSSVTTGASGSETGAGCPAPATDSVGEASSAMPESGDHTNMTVDPPMARKAEHVDMTVGSTAESGDHTGMKDESTAESADHASEPSGTMTQAGDSSAMTGHSPPEAGDAEPAVMHPSTCPLAHEHHAQPSGDGLAANPPEPQATDPAPAEQAAAPAASAEPPSGSIVTSVEVEVEVAAPAVLAESPVSEPLTVTAVTTATGATTVSSAVTATITGVRCRKGHFNDPELAYCGVCGIGLTQAGRVSALAERPMLGVLLLDDGRLLPLDRDYVLGSTPDLAEDVQRGEATAVRIQDDLVSGLHARVSLRGWEVNVSDIGSTHGTYVREPGGSSWEPVSHGGHRTLRPGGLIAIGARQLRFDTYRN